MEKYFFNIFLESQMGWEYILCVGSHLYDGHLCPLDQEGTRKKEKGC